VGNPDQTSASPRTEADSAKADGTFQLTQREKITLGLLAQYGDMTVLEMTEKLELVEAENLPRWTGRLQTLNIVRHAGRTKGTRYFIDPKLLKEMDFPIATTPSRIEPHRLKELVLEDLRRYQRSSVGEIRLRIGAEIGHRRIKRSIDTLIKQGIVGFEGVKKKWRRYWISE
jgi:ATP-dependent DNA helicase RecG